jgi:hypothetical protein
MNKYTDIKNTNALHKIVLWRFARKRRTGALTFSQNHDKIFASPKIAVNILKEAFLS